MKDYTKKKPLDLIWKALVSQKNKAWEEDFEEDLLFQSSNEQLEDEYDTKSYLPIFILSSGKSFPIYEVGDLDECFPEILDHCYGKTSEVAIGAIEEVYTFYNKEPSYFHNLLLNFNIQNKDLLVPPFVLLNLFIDKAINLYALNEDFSFIESRYICQVFSMLKDKSTEKDYIEKYLPKVISLFPERFFEMRTYPYYIQNFLFKSSCSDLKKFLLVEANSEPFYSKNIDFMNLDNDRVPICKDVWFYLMDKFSIKENCKIGAFSGYLLGHYLSEFNQNNKLSDLPDYLKQKVFQECAIDELMSCFSQARCVGQLINQPKIFADILKQYPDGADIFKKHYDYCFDYALDFKIIPFEKLVSILDYFMAENLQNYGLVLIEKNLTKLQKQPSLAKDFWQTINANLREEKLKDLEKYALKMEFTVDKKKKRELL